MNIDFNYIEEDKHIGNQEYFKTKVSYKNKDNFQILKATTNLYKQKNHLTKEQLKEIV